MFKFEETGLEIRNDNNVRFRIYLPGIEKNRDFSVKVYVINKKDQFNPHIKADSYDMAPDDESIVADKQWGDIAKNRWCSDFVPMMPGTYFYRFEITGPKCIKPDDGVSFEDPCIEGISQSNQTKVRSLYFGDPCARETDAGVFSVFHIPDPGVVQSPWTWDDSAFKVPALNDLILYEINVAEFASTFAGVADRIPYLLSLVHHNINFLS